MSILISMQNKEKEVFSRTDPHLFYNKLNYHLKKVEPFRNRTKRTVAEQMRLYTRNQKVSTITKNNKFYKKPLNEETDKINEEHVTQNLTNAASQIKIYQTPGSDRKNIFQRSDSDGKKKKIQLAHRGKSLKFWKVQKPEPKIISHLIGFFNTFLSENDGCRCGPHCQCKQILLKWISVPDDLIDKNYTRLLKIAYKKEAPKNSKFSETEYSQSQNYDSDYENNHKKQKEREKHMVQIKKDVTRTQTQCQLFHRPQIQQKLQRMLMCYSIEDPEVGYVQSMNIIVSGILYHVRDEAKTYAICRKLFHQIRLIYLNDFKECYRHVDYITKQLQLQVFDLYEHLEQTGVEMRVVLFPWVLSLLCVVVPLEYLKSIYIGFVKQGWRFIYKTILSVFVYHKDKIKNMDESGDILVFLSASNQEKDTIDWEDIVRYGESLDLKM